MRVLTSARNIMAVTVLLFAVPFAVFAGTTLPCSSFSRDLKLGMTGGDVRSLQQVLNRSLVTQIASTGPGSSGQETDFFGPLTKIGVTKFQELHKGTVLTPNGLVRGTGYVGKSTRAELIATCANSAGTPGLAAPSLGEPQPTGIVLPKMSETLTPINMGLGGSSALPSVSETGATIVMYPNSYTASPGSAVSLLGAQFAPTGNDVHIGDTHVVMTTEVSAFGTLDFVLPTDVPFGKVAVWVTNAKGESNKTFLIIRSPGLPTPVISSVTPLSGKLGNTIVLSGSGFAPSGNEVRFGGVALGGLPSSDGKTITFIATSTVYANARNWGTTTPRIPFFVYVLNAGGVSNAQPFTLTF